MNSRWSRRALVTAFLDSRADASLRAALESDADWENLIAAAADELVLPALRSRLAEIGITIPPRLEEFLAAVEEMNQERNERILDEARAIAESLNAIGIEPAFLKGAAYLVEGVLPSCPERPLSGRYLCDLDLLIPESRLRDAAAALEGQGYEPDASDEMAPFRHHYPQLQRPCAADGGGSAPVELHRWFGHGVARRLLSADEVLADSRRLEWRGVRIRIPSPEHLVTHLILHSQIHHCYSERIWPPVRAMQDLVFMAQHFAGQIDWDAVSERFRRQGHEPSLQLHLLQTFSTLGLECPMAIRPRFTVRLRMMRRWLLYYLPTLRFIDPAYLFSSALSRRLQFLQSISAVPGGLRQATRMLMRRGFYRRLFAEVSLR